jgi:3alpha(or 20beta)-hydroxysteroid dehydrogenase
MHMLRDKVAIVTGASRGLGAAIARGMADAGASVIMTDVLDGEAAAAGVREGGGQASFIRHDVRDPAGWAAVVNAAQAQFGRIDILVNNAGISKAGVIEEVSLQDFQDSIDVNLLGAFQGMQAVIPAMRAAGGGSIINIASAATVTVSSVTTIYAATKAAVASLSKSVAVHLAQSQSGIRVNSIHPGPADTSMMARVKADPAVLQAMVASIPMGRLGKPAEVAAVAVFLASDAAAYVTGAEYFVDGGWTLT